MRSLGVWIPFRVPWAMDPSVDTPLALDQTNDELICQLWDSRFWRVRIMARYFCL